DEGLARASDVVAHTFQIKQGGASLRRLPLPPIGADVCAPHLPDAPVESLRSLSLIEVNELGNEGMTKIESGVERQHTKRIGRNRRLRRREDRNNCRRVRTMHDMPSSAINGFTTK